ncbi:MAG: ATP-dependent Clp protease ATP-binding subunit [Planctomycetes bacterium]|nr:ATP-dependent Clp protease ATP-binding subunit [Planctomycetota bacterium]
MYTADILKPGATVLKEKGDFTLVGRDEELASMINILSRRAAHNVILTGQGGVGCSALTLGLQKAKSDPKTPFDIIHKRIWWLDTDGLFSDPDKAVEQFDSMLSKVSNTADKDTLLVIDDARNFIDAALNSGNNSFINRMMRHLEQGRFQVIFEVRDADLEKVLMCHSSMSELFTIMEVKPPAKDKLLDIVTASAQKLFEHHGVKVDPEAIDQAIYLTTTYPGKERSLMRSQPEASLTLIDRALATYKNASHANPPEVQALKEQLARTPDDAALQDKLNTLSADWEKRRNEMKSASESQAYGEAHIIKLESELAALQAKKEPDSGSMMMSSREEQELHIKLSEARKIVKQNSEKFKSFYDEVNAELLLTADHVFREFSKLSGIPFDKLNEDETEKLLTLPAELKKRVFGQDHVIDKISDALLMARTPGLKDPGKPELAVMFCGSSGVGKTEIAKALALILKDDERELIRFDMSEYTEKNNVTSLIGAPPGYAGYEDGGVLTNAVRKRPNSIILFDEIEKAHTSIFDIFLQVLDDGRLTDTQGLTVSFEHTILIFTTNTGAEHMLNDELTFKEQREGTLDELSKVYRAEFLNRFGGRQDIVMFKTLPMEVINMIARRAIEKVNERMRTANVDMTICMGDDDVVRLCDYEYDPVNGARGIEGVFKTQVFPKLARILKADEAYNRVDVKFVNGEFSLTPSIEEK